MGDTKSRRDFGKVLITSAGLCAGLALSGTGAAEDSIEDSSAKGTEEETDSPQGVGTGDQAIGEYNDDPTPAVESTAEAYADSLTTGGGGSGNPEDFSI